jgi:hypothetical protein
MNKILSVFSCILFVAGYVPYIRTILRKETIPAKATWIIWATLDSVILIGLCLKHAINWQIIGAVIGTTIVSIISLKYGSSGWTKLDKLCSSGAIIGILLSIFFRNPMFGIIICLIVALIGCFPTFASSWKHPELENKFAWTIWFISCLLTVFIIPQWTLTYAAQPIVFLIFQTVMIYILFIHAYFMKKDRK